MMVLIVIAILVLIGLIFGTVALVVIVTKVIHRHLRVLKKRRDAEIYRVANMDGKPLPMVPPPSPPLMNQYVGGLQSTKKDDVLDV